MNGDLPDPERISRFLQAVGEWMREEKSKDEGGRMKDEVIAPDVQRLQRDRGRGVSRGRKVEGGMQRVEGVAG